MKRFLHQDTSRNFSSHRFNSIMRKAMKKHIKRYLINRLYHAEKIIGPLDSLLWLPFWQPNFFLFYFTSYWRRLLTAFLSFLPGWYAIHCTAYYISLTRYLQSCFHSLCNVLHVAPWYLWHKYIVPHDAWLQIRLEGCPLRWLIYSDYA